MYVYISSLRLRVVLYLFNKIIIYNKIVLKRFDRNLISQH